MPTLRRHQNKQRQGLNSTFKDVYPKKINPVDNLGWDPTARVTLFRRTIGVLSNPGDDASTNINVGPR
jgi:hypothetical protein